MAPPPPPPTAPAGGIAEYFKFAERGTDIATEARAGLTTFMVMAYIIFLNGNIIAKPLGLDPIAVSAGTALIAGIMTIAMGLVGNYPFALAAGLGINAIVAFTLTAKGLDAKGAMGVIVLEGVAITVLVAIGLREAIMNAVPIALKRAIGVGIGLFILFIGFANGGMVVSNCAPDSADLGFCDGTLVTLSFPTTPGQFVFLLGLAITIILYARKVRAALIISILVTTVIAILVGVQKVDTNLVTTPSFATLGLGLQDPFQAFTKLGALTAVLTIFAIMLSDFFDTMGTVTGIAAEAGLAREDGSVPGVGRVLLVDSIAAIAGGVGGVSSNTTYIESAAGVAEGGRTGFASVVTGILFLLAIFLSPIAGFIPAQATAPALVLVGYLMFTLVKDIPVADIEDGLPALLTMILMPLTYDITVGIGAGFITWVLLKVVRGKLGEIHPLMWVVSIAFLIYFAYTWIQTVFKLARRRLDRSAASHLLAGAAERFLYHRADVRTDRAARGTPRDQCQASDGALGLHRRLRPGRIPARDGRSGRGRPFHGAPHLQGHKGLPDDACHQRGDRGGRRLLQRRDGPGIDRLLGPCAAPRGGT
ncbi:MAG: adenine/guanine/hypoxanthine permease, partial [Chloroflexota bacterium]|nr:adenine/guanine/hypoxanthine permease [Chloroflexota bacterium]